MNKVLVDRSMGPCNCGPEPAGDSGESGAGVQSGCAAYCQNTCGYLREFGWSEDEIKYYCNTCPNEMPWRCNPGASDYPDYPTTCPAGSVYCKYTCNALREFEWSEDEIKFYCHTCPNEMPWLCNPGAADYPTTAT